jgi:2-polyprenyl-3-methyl-5-hydroxy-6-metoxy-1,4-benzoquinol methylase
MATSQPAEVRIPIEPRDQYRWEPQDCPICRRPPTKFLGKRGGSAHRTGLGVECDIWRCGQCGLIFPNPMPVPIHGLEQHYGVDSAEYFQHHDCDTKTAYAHFFLKEAVALCGKKGRLLDIGAGRGEFLRAAVDDGWEAVGIEPSPQFAKYASQHSGVAVIPKPIEQCHFEAGTFDVILLSGVLEHLYHPDDTIREIARVLRKGGALFLDVPNEAGLYFRSGNFYEHLRGRNWVVNLAPTFPPYHVFGFTPRSLRSLLAKHGLTPAKWRVYGGHAMVPASGGLMGSLEQGAARAVTALSKFGSLGTYIETWAIRS